MFKNSIWNHFTSQSVKPKILAFAGSTRDDSFNKKLVKIAAAGASESDADVTVIDLRDFPMPLYDEDLERHEGLTLQRIETKGFDVDTSRISDFIPPNTIVLSQAF